MEIHEIKVKTVKLTENDIRTAVTSWLKGRTILIESEDILFEAENSCTPTGLTAIVKITEEINPEKL